MCLVVLLSVLAQTSPDLPELRPSNLGGIYRRHLRTGLVTVDGPYLTLTEARESGVLRVLAYDPRSGVRELARNGNLATDFRHAQAGSLVVTSGSESLMGDLNADGDALDLCVIASDLASGELLPPRAIHLNTDGSWGPFVAGGLVGFTLSEAGEGLHLNGDPDLNDYVGAVWKPGLPSALVPGRGSLAVYPLENAMLLRVAEQGERDFTTDGDKTDWVDLVYDLATETLHNTGVALLTSQLYAFTHPGTRVFSLPASEAGSEADLNGDGDQTDQLLMAYSLDRGVLDLLCESGPTFPHLDSGRWVAFTNPESVAGDLNGDGDALDDVLEVYDGATGTIVNTGWAFAGNMLAILGGSELGFLVGEGAQGADLDGDGDTSDYVFFQRNFATGTTRNTGLGASASGGILLAYEYANGRDLNGDGDLDDTVPQILQPAAAGPGASLGVASSEVKLSEGWAALLVSESGQGADLNGDGDQLDRVLHGYERATGTLTNFGLVPPANGWALAGRLVGCVLDEAGVVDLNGDGDTLDHVVHRVDLKTGEVVNLHLATGASDPLWMTNDLLAFVVEELDQGADLDGNGQIEDVGVVHVVGRGRILRR